MGQSPLADAAGDVPAHVLQAEIQARIDALLIAWQYADPEERTLIQARIDALQIALNYAEND